MSAQNPINILLIEDDPDDVLLLKEALAKSSDYLFHVILAGRLNTGLDFLAEGGIDVVMLDLNLLDSRGLETLDAVDNSFPEVPVIVLTDLGDNEAGIAAVQRGAQDYLIKGQITTPILERAVFYAIERRRLLQSLKVREAQTQQLIESNADGMLVIDRSGIMRLANPAAEKLLARPASAIVGEMFGFPVVAGESVALDLVGSDRKGTNVEMRVVEIEWDGKIAYLASLRDVTAVYV